MKSAPLPGSESGSAFSCGEKVMIDGNRAELYGVQTRVLNQATRATSSP
jgi:hypothetical protein